MMFYSFLLIGEAKPTESVSLLNIWKYVWRGICAAFQWIIDQISSLTSWVKTGVINSVSNSFHLDRVVTADLMDLINDWVPLDFALSCVFSYFSVAACIWTINWILGLIPNES